MNERRKLITKKSSSAMGWISSQISVANPVTVARSFKLSEPLDAEAFKGLAFKILGYVVLILSISGGSSIGVVSDMLPVDSPFIKNSWRAMMILIYFFIPVLIENYFLYHKTNYRAIFSRKTYPIVVMACIC